MADMFANSGSAKKEKNPNYPDENNDEFVFKMIKKKKRIELELDVLGIED